MAEPAEEAVFGADKRNRSDTRRGIPYPDAYTVNTVGALCGCNRDVAQVSVGIRYRQLKLAAVAASYRFDKILGRSELFTVHGGYHVAHRYPRIRCGADQPRVCFDSGDTDNHGSVREKLNSEAHSSRNKLHSFRRHSGRSRNREHKRQTDQYKKRPP